jgi:hypothetical protein
MKTTQNEAVASRHRPIDTAPPAQFGSATLLFTFLFSLFTSLVGCTEILSPDITTHTLTLNSPNDSLYTAASTLTFWWEKDPDIEHYQLRITTQTSGSLTLIQDTTLVANTYSHAFTQDNAYTWQVRGVNEGSETDWHTGTLYIDQTTPDKATATHMHGDTLQSGNTATLEWYSTDYPLAGTTYPVKDSLYLYRKNDSTEIAAKWYYNTIDPRTLAITATTPSPMNGPGTYYWRIITIDQAGNRQSSDQFRFTVQ